MWRQVCPSVLPAVRRRGRRAVCALMALMVLGGCTTIRRGGAPEPSFDANEDLQQLAKEFAPAGNITAFYDKGKDATGQVDPSKAATKEDRDKIITGRLTLMNIRYIQFIRELTSDQQLLNTATDMLVLGLNIAGTAVGGAGAKTLMAAIAAGVTGSKQIVDKNYFYEKTIPALVAQMNAERKTALIPIIAGVQQSLSDYPLAQAITDLHNYYHAGTLIGAINAIQADAGAKERDKDAIIATLSPVTMKDVENTVKLTQSIGALKDVAPGKAALATLGVDTAGVDTLDGVKAELQRQIRSARTTEKIARVTKAFRDAGILAE
jgi:hypothetical protein